MTEETRLTSIASTERVSSIPASEILFESFVDTSLRGDSTSIESMTNMELTSIPLPTEEACAIGIPWDPDFEVELRRVLLSESNDAAERPRSRDKIPIRRKVVVGWIGLNFKKKNIGQPLSAALSFSRPFSKRNANRS
jgi:hypothetical protein